MRVGIYIRREVDWRNRDALFLGRQVEIVLLPDSGPFRQVRRHDIDTLGPDEAVGEDLFPRPLWVAHHFNQILPLGFFAEIDEDPSVLGRIESSGRVSVPAQARRLAAGVGVPDQRALQHSNQAFLFANLDSLTAAALDPVKVGGQRCECRISPALELGLMAEELQRRAIGKWRSGRARAGLARGMRDVEFIGTPICSWAMLAEGRNRGDDQMGVGSRDGVAGHRNGGAIHGRDVVNENVRIGKETVQAAAVRWILQVQSDALLVGIEVEGKSAHFGVGLPVEEGAAPAGDIAPRRFDLHHLGAKQRQQLGGIRRGDALPAFDNRDPRQGQMRRLRGRAG
jgi:hypothetical protein